VKIAFDENVPLAMVRVFQLFQKEKQLQVLSRGLEVVKAKDFTPSREDPDYIRKNDAPWIRRFGKAGGKIIVSGDTNMKNVPQERLALVEEKMIVFFFDSQWSKWPFSKKCSLLLRWWPDIVAKAKKARAPKFYHIPSTWSDDATLRSVSTKDQKLVKVERQKKAQTRVAAQRKAKKATKELQPSFDFEGKRHHRRRSV
jgi:hypothetical protein